MIVAAFLLMLQSAPPPPPPIAVPNTPEQFGPGPHTLIISDGKGMTQLDYKTGRACQVALEEIRKQVAPPHTAHYGISAVKTFCVPR